MRFTIVLWLILVTAVAGCVSKKATLQESADPTAPVEELEAIAVFPPTDASFDPNEVQHLNRKISDGIHAHHADMRIVSDLDLQKVMEEKGLAGDWSRFVDSYVTSGKPDRDLLGKMGEALGVDGILLGEIVSSLRQDGGYEENSPATTRVTVRFSLFDVESGKLAWEASSEAVVETGTMVESAPPVRDAVQVAVDKIMGAFPE